MQVVGLVREVIRENCGYMIGVMMLEERRAKNLEGSRAWLKMLSMKLRSPFGGLPS